MFFTTTQKTLFFWAFLKFSFSMFFMFCLFLFPTWKRQKQKVHIFFENPFFDTLTNCQKIIFAPHTHYLCFFRYPKNTIKLGKNKQKKILDQVLTQPWTRFWLKKPQILDQVLTLQHIYIYIYAVELITWPSKVNNLAICFFFIFFVVFCCFSKIFFFLQGEWDFWKKTSFNKKSVKKVELITWPSFWAKFWPKKWPSY